MPGNREIRLKSRPNGVPTQDNFELIETQVPEPLPGQILVHNLFMSVDPYMRGRMIDRPSYVPPFQVGEALGGGAVGKVVASRGHRGFSEGDYVSNFSGWREWFASDGTALQKIDPRLAPIEAYLGAFGMPGLTAYAGLLRVGELKQGEHVFVSAASGAVGAVACQIARNKGCRVVGSAGSDEKCAWLVREAGIDQAINYKTTGALGAAIRAALPEGIDVYFENVGGAHLEAALANMRRGGRIVVCGMIAQYNDSTPPPGPSNIAMLIPQRLSMKGFIVTDHTDMMPDFYRDMAAWTKAGQMKWQETIVDGIENAPTAFIGLFKGENFGKMLVRLARE